MTRHESPGRVACPTGMSKSVDNTPCSRACTGTKTAAVQILHACETATGSQELQETLSLISGLCGKPFSSHRRKQRSSCPRQTRVYIPKSIHYSNLALIVPVTHHSQESRTGLECAAEDCPCVQNSTTHTVESWNDFHKTGHHLSETHGLQEQKPFVSSSASRDSERQIQRMVNRYTNCTIRNLESSMVTEISYSRCKEAPLLVNTTLCIICLHGALGRAEWKGLTETYQK